MPSTRPPTGPDVPTLTMQTLDRFHHLPEGGPLGASRVWGGFHINRIEDYLAHLPFPLPPHRKAFTDMIFLTGGTSVRFKGLTKYTFGPGQLFVLPAYQITAHEHMSPDARGFYLHFNPEMLRERGVDDQRFAILNFTIHPVVAFPPDTRQAVLHLFERLETIYQTLDPPDLDLVTAYLVALLFEADRCMDTCTTRYRNAAAYLTQRFKDALSRHIYELHTVQAYADLLGVTPNHLNKCVRATLGRPAKSLIREMMVMEAKHFLRHSSLQIAEIAFRLGEQSPSNFARFFKSETGLTPREYRESLT